MNTIRSCFATIVAFLVIAIGWWATDAVVCCNSSSVATVGGDVVASCQNKNRTFHTIEAIGGVTCDDDRTAVPVRKCCPLGQSYNPKERFCRPGRADGDEHLQRMVQLLRDEFRAVADAVMVGYDYEQPLCDAADVLVDVLTVEVSRLMDTYSSVLELPPGYCFDLTPSDELVARTCQPRDQICGQENYTCVHKCCKGDRMIVDDPNGPQCKQSMKPFKMYAYDHYRFEGPSSNSHGVSLSDNTVLPYYVEFNCSHGDKVNFEFVLTVNGSLYLFDEDLYVPDTEYCVEYSPVAKGNVVFICDVNAVFKIPRVRDSSIPLFHRASYVASAVCLALTLLVYNILPSLRNIRNYYVKCYIGHQFVSYVCVIAQISMENEKGRMCVIFGYISLFVFLSTLCWSNVICFDIYWMIRYNISINRNTSTSVRTIMYYFYSWGLPSIFVCSGFFFEYSQKKFLHELVPNFEAYGCFYYNMSGLGSVVFIMLPVFVILTVNLVLFRVTSNHSSRIKSELNELNRTDSNTENVLLHKEK
ncbi:uncharacterized protein LOC100166298 isoform X2 [Acyrthosiphon pisum]|nr:uncharacterized protein LOC100166298 isoform X2 [Acyrthosiphon pisum]|eukprot:XP_016657336.1 PREDICTED: uncharacterized protein LOC100166298 isoform X2 [Acyrthosiphon pisum]